MTDKLTQPTADELLPCPTCGATDPEANVFCSDGYHAKGPTYWPCSHCNGTGNSNTRAPSTADEPTDAMIEQLVRNAYEEGVEDGVGWRAYPESGPRPQWIDSVARIETLKAMRTARTSE